MKEEGSGLVYMSGKRILFIEAINLSPHIETSMELVDLELKKGNNVYYYFIGHALKYPPVWGITIKRNWWNAIFLPENKAARLVKPTYFENVKNMTRDINQFVEVIEISNNIESIKKIEYEGICLGQSVFGDYLGYRGTYHIESVDDKKLVRDLFFNALQSLLFFIEVFDKNKIDEVCMFNGRYTFSHPIWKYCKLNKIICGIHERGSSTKTYFFSQHDSIHSISQTSQRIKETRIENESQARIGHEFFTDKRVGKESGWVSFKKTTDLSKIQIPKHDKIVIFYTSSEFEFEAVSDQNEKYENFESQIESIQKVAEISLILDFKFIIRVHPNMESSLDFLKELKYLEAQDNVIIYWPSDPIDTYELLDIAKITITFGSTMGVESMYYNKPCISLHPSTYDYVDGLFIPKNHIELHELLDNLLKSKIKFQRNEGDLLKFGYYYRTFGVPFKYYEPSSNGFHKGLFMGKNLQKSWLHEKILAFIN